MIDATPEPPYAEIYAARRKAAEEAQAEGENLGAVV